MSIVRYCRDVLFATLTFTVMPSVPAASLLEIDWEKTPAFVRPPTAGDYSPYVDPFFSSRKTLPETTNWLRQTIERYGDVPPRRVGDDANWTGNVGFNGCTMTWTSRRISDSGTNIEERNNSLNLADIDGRSGAIQVDNSKQVGGSIRAGMRSGTVMQSAARYYTVTNGRRTDRGQRVETEQSFLIYVLPDNDLPRRIAQALLHASRQCGGPMPSR